MGKLGIIIEGAQSMQCVTRRWGSQSCMVKGECCAIGQFLKSRNVTLQVSVNNVLRMSKSAIEINKHS